MKLMVILFVIVLWFGLGIVGAGFDNAYFQRKWPSQCDGRRDHARAMLFIPVGPINAFFSFMFTGYGEYGWSLAIVANPKCEGRVSW